MNKNSSITFSEEEMNKLKQTTILELAQQLEDVIVNQRVREDTNVLDFIKHYLHE